MNDSQKKVISYTKPLWFLMGLLSAFTVCGYIDGVQTTLQFSLVFSVLIIGLLAYLVYWCVKLSVLKPQPKKDVPQ